MAEARKKGDAPQVDLVIRKRGDDRVELRPNLHVHIAHFRLVCPPHTPLFQDRLQFLRRSQQGMHGCRHVALRGLLEPGPRVGQIRWKGTSREPEALRTEPRYPFHPELL